MKTMLMTAVAAMALAGCAALPAPWSAVGGSRADATVKLAYSYGPFQRIAPNDGVAAQLAASRCAVWGYGGAEAFGASSTRCNVQNGAVCNEWLVTREYQCTGTGR